MFVQELSDVVNLAVDHQPAVLFSRMLLALLQADDALVWNGFGYHTLHQELQVTMGVWVGQNLKEIGSSLLETV